MKVAETGADRWDEGIEAAATLAALADAAAVPPPPARQRFAFLTAEGQSATPLEQEALLGTNDLLETSFLDRCLLVGECIGRVQFVRPQGRGYATGFLIAPGILLTNHHVFPDAAAARGASIEFGYRYNVAGQLPVDNDEHDLHPDQFFVADETLDFAAVAVAERSTLGRDVAARGYLRLIPMTGKAEMGEFVTIIQHPDGAPMQIALRENQIIRLEDSEPRVWYRADTAHGSSGAGVFNDTLQLIALHSSGQIQRDAEGRYALKDGRFVDTLDGLDETDVIWEANVGYRISRIVPSLTAAAHAASPAHAARIEAAMVGGDVLSAAVARLTGTRDIRNPKTEESMTSVENQGGAAVGGPSTGELVVPLQLRISLGLGGVAGAGLGQPLADGGERAALESEAMQMRIPIIYDELDKRPGFNAAFLDLADGEDAPRPRLTDEGRALAAPLLDGSGIELKYRHFSIWMHKQRRLALVAASNVDWRARKKMVDGKSTSRKPLAGFPETPPYAEQWVNDPRIDAAHQLPDKFYSDDRGAFDKGHIVRRDDVCWGDTYAEIQMANGDTYHVTNCSPQIKPFNQGAEGVENWGDFEGFVQEATKRDNEKSIIYAGPVFGQDDRWFRGKDDGGAVRVQIPVQFWKIVVVKGEDGGAQAFGFVLKQDVTAITEKEFFVTDEWKGEMRRISEIEDLMRGWISLAELAAVDQFERVQAGG